MAETFGSYLKQERELRNITLEELSEQTHIKMDYLEAMEGDHFEKLPGLTFAKGYITSYAKYIGLLPEEALLQFEDYLSHLSGEGRNRLDRNNPRMFWLVAFLFLVVVATVVILWFRK
ncbi:MAG: helix-turn-helix domain-containing protein [bacterium]|nr:helix-turn-helix domain-containing protein [bacterium]